VESSKVHFYEECISAISGPNEINTSKSRTVKYPSRT